MDNDINDDKPKASNDSQSQCGEVKEIFARPMTYNGNDYYNCEDLLSEAIYW